jgi:HSP20 family protein
MDFDKLKQWMEVSQKYQNGKFWDMVFEQQAPSEEMMNEFEEEQQDLKRDKSPLVNFPKTDIYLTDTAVIVLLEIPGVIKEDVFLSVSGNKLSVRGVIKMPIMNGMPILTERKYGEFQRIIELPEPTASRNIQARFERGLLVVTYARRYIQEEPVSIT